MLERVKDFYLKYKRVIDYSISFAVIFSFLCIVTNSVVIDCYNKDEIHAWNIATDLNFIQIIKLMKAEGHTFIWYMLLKPFTHYPEIFYPWIIKYLNLFFVFISVCLLWLFAPFNKIIKFLIIFSYPFLCCFGILGRCYGIGILLLFILAILYKKRLKYPIIFSILLFAAANTSLMASIGIFGICMVFVYDLFKIQNIKKSIVPIFIMALIPLSLYIQWHGHIVLNYIYRHNLFSLFKFNLFYSYKDYINSIIPKFVILSGVIISFLFFKNAKSILFSLISSFAIFTFFAIKIYCMFDYHYLFMFVVFCMHLWIYEDNFASDNSKRKISPVFKIWFVIFCILLSPMYKDNGYWFSSRETMVNTLECIYNIIPKGSVIYTTMYSLGAELPDLRDKYELKTFNGDDMFTFDSYLNTYNVSRKYAKPNMEKIRSMNVGDRDKYIVVHEKYVNRFVLNKNFRENAYKCEYIYVHKLDR